MFVVYLTPRLLTMFLFVCFAYSMNPSQERLAKTLVAKARRALKDAQTGSGPTPASGSGNQSSVQATVALSPIDISLKAKGYEPREVST